MKVESNEELLARIEELENRLAESEQLIEAIKAGEVDAFAISSDNQSEIYTLQSGDYAYRVLIEEFGEGAINVTEEGLIVYTNTYFFELIGMPYEKVMGSLIADLVHEDSKEEFTQLFNAGLKGKSKGEINLAANNRIIPVYISLTSLQPKLPTVGIIITDFTEKEKNKEVILKYQRDLEVKNQALVQSNTDLASFAYIASHDLQEPLRKIQTFTKRIFDKEYDSLSTNAQDYFQRLMSAAKRMQNLITDLLNYSRLNTTEIVFVPTDLNLLLKEVINDLHELIVETDTVIKISSLPTLNVVSHQFNQLLSNIIINAIKFRKSEVNPVINISADIIPVDEIENQGFLSEDRYWKIQISDNGIGFEQAYADKIFDLFQRLHGRSEYEGTGIGLAICKKILQTHNGFITASGELNVGATFNLYLPVNELV